MKTLRLIILFAVLIISPACQSTTPLTNTPAPTQSILQPSDNQMGDADVLYVSAQQQGDLSWTVSVTVEHPDTGWEDYADGWDVVLANGEVLKRNPSDLFTRLLTHPHLDEQPFTRSQSGILIPENEHIVIVRAHDMVDGFGGKTVIVNLETPKGDNFEVDRSSWTALSTLGLTNHNLDGNRYVTGQIDLEAAREVNIPLNGIPAWVVGAAQPDGSLLWLAALEDGTLQLFKVDGSGYSEDQPPISSLPAGTPPALMIGDSELAILNSLFEDSSPSSSPIFTPDERAAYIDVLGRVTIQSAELTQSLPVAALPDGRILSDEAGNLLLLSDPTTLYQHAVLGDGLESQTITLVKNEDGERPISVITVPEGQVIEGIAPIWTDLNADGEREIIVTLSDAQNGAQLAVFSEAGEIAALSDSIGTGYRWRHQIAAAPFGPNGEMEIVDVLTPHIGGVVEFFQMDVNLLTKTAQIRGYTSHIIGSRNLDMALAADVDADGQIELLLPNQQLTELGVIQRTADGASAAFEIPLDGKLTSNIAGIKLGDGTIAIAAGLDNATLKIWMPQQDN